MSEQNPKKMSVTQLTLLTAINMMGSGIVMLPTKLAEIGTISILSWVITAFGSLCLAYAFAKCGMFSKRPGMGGYAEYAFGKAGNFLANYTYGISLLFANIAIALTCVGYGSELLGISLSPIHVCLSHDCRPLALHIRQLHGCIHYRKVQFFSCLVRCSSRSASERHRVVLVQSDPVRRILESASSPFLLCGGGFYFHDALGFLRPGKCLRQQRCR